MTHGNSKAHRAPGSIGACEYPGKVWKGKKMAGRTGNDPIYKDNVMVMKIEEDHDLIYLKGPIPGNKKGLIKMRDARRMQILHYLERLYPTYVVPQDQEARDVLPRTMIYEGAPKDPFEDYTHDNELVGGKDFEDD